MKTFSDQIKDLEATRAAKAARMEEIMNKSMAEDRTMDDAEAEEFDTIETEIQQIDKDLSRLSRLQALNVQSGKSVDGARPGQDARTVASAVRSVSNEGGQRISAPYIQVAPKDQEEKFKGQNYTRLVIAKTLAQLDGVSASGIAKARWGKSNPTLVALIKANEVSGGGAGTDEWGSELVDADNRYTGDFIEFLTSRTIFDQLGLREVPANITIKGQDGIGTGYWVGESLAIPVSAQDFSNVSLTPLKVAAISVISIELMRDSSPAAEALVRDGIVEAAAQRIDGTFLSTTIASAGVSPAGMLWNVTPITSNGTDGDGVRADIKELYAPFITAKNASGLSFVANTSLAKSLQLMRNALGQKEFPEITQNGGTLEGDPVATGDNVNANHLILLKPSDIFKIGDMGVQVTMSRDATIEMNSVPVGDSETPTASSESPVSMFQTESVALKVVRPMNFQKRRSHAVQYVSDADYGAVASA